MGTLKKLVVLALLSTQLGCSYWFGKEGQFRERAMDYQKADTIPHLAMPEGMESVPLQQRYPIPSVPPVEHFDPTDSDQVPKPQSLLNVDSYAGVELRRNEERIWMLVDKSPADTFSLVKSYLIGAEIAIDQANVDAGTIETDWLTPIELESEQGFWKSIGRFFTGGNKHKRERYRFLVSPRVNEPGSIITINQLKVKQPVPPKVDWPSLPQDQEAVTQVFNELMDYLGEYGHRVGASVLSHDVNMLPKYTMTWDGNGLPVLVINKDFNHAWLDVHDALAKAKLPVIDLDRSLGVFYLAAEQLDAEGFELDVEEDKNIQVKLVSSESGIQVAVQLDDDTVANKELSAAILNRLRESLE